MPFASLKAALQKMQGDAETLFNRVKDKGTLNNVVAAGALIAYADGTCDASEKAKTLKVIQAKMPHFGAGDVVAAWKKTEDLLDLDFDFGKPDVLNQLKSAQNTPTADLIVRTAILIGGADGDFDDDEKAVVREICTAVGLSPSEYGL